MRKEEARRLIKEAIRYKSNGINSVYMGGILIAIVYHAIGLQYGRDDIDVGLDCATTEQLIKALSVCQATIDYMTKNPTKNCAHCGQIIPR